MVELHYVSHGCNIVPSAGSFPRNGDHLAIPTFKSIQSLFPNFGAFWISRDNVKFLLVPSSTNIRVRMAGEIIPLTNEVILRDPLDFLQLYRGTVNPLNTNIRFTFLTD